MTKSFKQQATDTCVEAITTSSKNLVEVVATKLAALHKSQGINTPLKFTAADASRIAFDARVKFNKAKGVAASMTPSKIEYDQSTTGPFNSFRARHLELTKIIGNIEHYTDAKATCDALVKTGTFKQAGASEMVRAMAAIGKGETADAFKAAMIQGKSERDTKAKKATADAKTPEGFDKALKKLVDAAAELDIVLGDDGKFVQEAPEPVIDPKKEIEAMPGEDTGAVLDQDALAAMMAMPQFQQAVQMAALMIVKK